jgi:Protein of unknown function (DUF4054)
MSLTWGCCTGPPVVTFSSSWFTTFTTMFPVFSCLTQAQGEAYFNLTGLYLENSPRNPAACVLPQLWWLVTAHIAWLMSPKDASGNPAPEGTTNGALVGRISQATQGSVNVSLELDATAGGPSEQWYAQTQWGLMAWQAMAQFRTARYTVSPTRVGGPVFPGAPWLPVNFWGPVTGLN